jgi:hypothetical protein
MPSQLLQRLNRFLDATVARRINGLETVPRVDTLGAVPPNDPSQPNEPAPNIAPHWKNLPWGNVMRDIRCVMLHETTGWPSYESSNNFQQLYECVRTWAFIEGHAGQPGRWFDRRGIGPQYFVDPAGTAFALIGPENLDGDARLTIHGESLNSFSLGIENADVGDGVDPGLGTGSRWWRLSTIPESDDDVPGQRVFLLLHPRGDRADANLIWFARLPRYAGGGDIQNIATRYPDWRNMLFTERNYRSLARKHSDPAGLSVAELSAGRLRVSLCLLRTGCGEVPVCPTRRMRPMLPQFCVRGTRSLRPRSPSCGQITSRCWPASRSCGPM